MRIGSRQFVSIPKRERSVEDFKIELAGIPIGIQCRFEINKRFLKDYITEKEPLFCIAPTDEDLLRSQEENRRQDKADGHPFYERSEASLENTAIHRLLAEKLTEYSVLLMHGSALSLDGEGYLFTAPSGTGKSTHARLWREAFGDRVVMINDDKPMLRIRNDGVFVYGTPWDGKHDLSCNTSAPLRAIISLNRGETNRIEPMRKADAFPILIRQAFASKDPKTMTRIVAMEQQILEQVRFYELFCNMEPDAAQTAYEGMKKETTQKGRR